VAQHRQRSRRRRTRQPGAGGPAAGSARTNPRDTGLEPTDTELGGTTPAPEPTKHAFPDVEEARMAEAGPLPGTVGEREAEEELPPVERVPDADTRERRPAGNRVLTFLRHVVDELRRVQWPDRRQVGQSTLVVLLFVIIAGGYLGLLDAIWKPLIDAIL
jgi:preprotein translocase SecE subunit